MEKSSTDKAMIDQNRFDEARFKIIGVDRERPTIGTLSEKTLHAILKNYYEPDEDHQEIPIENYVADIYRDDKIMEIQTRAFEKMRGKLSAFLPHYEVTIVHPIPYEKHLVWVNPETGELSAKRKSPKKGSVFHIFHELYKIKMFLTNPNLNIKICLVNMDEYKLLNGWSKDKKKGSWRYDRVPTSMIEEVDITCPRDYLLFLPLELPEQFTSKEYARTCHITTSMAQTGLNILKHVGAVRVVGKKGNAFLYEVNEREE